jgi:hypothetical protein
MNRRALIFIASTVAAAASGGVALLVACGPTSFPDESLINTVRILATSSDQPFAPPGATVHAQVLAVDGRPDASGNEPMRVFWLPFLCVDPPNDAFYACFSAFLPKAASGNQYSAPDGGGGGAILGSISAWDGGPDAAVGPSLLGGGDGGALGGGMTMSLASIPAGVDVSAFLIQGPRVAFHLPADIITAHSRAKGAFQYGLAVVFNIACAGHVEVVPPDPNNPNPEQIPFGCFNAQHQAVSANDYVIGYSEVFAYTSLTNHNPVISSFTFRDAGLPLEGGVAAAAVFPHCTESNTSKCPDNYAITGVPDASWEPDPQNPGPDGGPQHEELWVDYYATMGSLGDEAILLFDPVLGRITKPPEQEDLQKVTKKQVGTLWAVAHDNRNGVSWITVPLRAQ